LIRILWFGLMEGACPPPLVLLPKNEFGKVTI
jgi:hypothetical protein